jgi:hypothetical protein
MGSTNENPAGLRATFRNPKWPKSITWVKEWISEQFPIMMAKYSEIDKGKASIPPPAPKRSLGRASNRILRTIAQIRTGHWLCAPQVKPVRKNREEAVLDKIWLCGQDRMSNTHVVLICMLPNLKGTRKDSSDRPKKDGRN